VDLLLDKRGEHWPRRSRQRQRRDERDPGNQVGSSGWIALTRHTSCSGRIDVRTERGANVNACEAPFSRLPRATKGENHSLPILIQYKQILLSVN